MGETLPEGVSRQEFSGLLDEVKGLREALAELKEARTQPERREAQADVREAKADLAATARELGLDPKRLEDAASKARQEDERERLRPLLIELLDEELAVPDPADAADAAADALGAVPDAAADAAAAVLEPKPDSAPKMGHWSERPLSSLFGGD